MRMIGNLGDQVQQRAQTPRKHKPRKSDDDAKRSWDIFRAITRQPQDRAEGTKYDPDHSGNLQRTGPTGLACDFFRTEFGIVNAVAEENDDAERKPINESLPSKPRQRNHEVTGRYHPHRRDEPHCWRLKCPRQVRLTNSQDKNAYGNDHKCQQRTDRNKATSFSHSEDCSETSHNDSGHNGRDPWSLEFWMNPAHKLRQQPVISHGPENSGLTQQHHENNRAQTSYGAQFD